MRAEIRSGLGEPAQPCFAWQSPDGAEIAALGVTAEVVARGPGRMEAIRARLGILVNGADTGGPSPLAIGGFAFDLDGDARFTLPARIWSLTERRPTACATWSTDAGSDPLQSTPRGAMRRAPSQPGEAGRGKRPDPAPPGAARGGDLSRADWNAAVNEALKEIERGTFSKVVLARSLEISAERPLDPLAIFESLGREYPSCQRFLLYDGEGRAFLGASPERLVRLQAGTIEAEAVAGTIPRGADPAEDGARERALLESAKDRLEHDLVVEHVRDALAPLGTRLAHSGSPEVLTLRNVHHLRTLITAHANPGTHVLDLVCRLHPSPAVAGSPRESALRWIAAREPVSRGWYAGPIGWVNAAGEGDFTVGIRSVAIEGCRARLFAGAGIVAGSDPDREWAETEIKMRPILDALARA